MIRDINANSEYLTVSSTTTPTYINNFNGLLGAGNMRFNTSTQNMEVYDGNNWIILTSGTSHLDVSFRTKEILRWAEKKMAEEAKLEEQCKQYPGLAKARDNFEMFKKIVETDTYTGEGSVTSPT